MARRARATTRADDRRREVPSIDTLLRSQPGRNGTRQFGKPLVKHALQGALAGVRDEAALGRSVPGDEVIMARALGVAARSYYGLSGVINATGVILHTGLGRAPLPARAARAAAEAARTYSDLEIDRETGGRGRRTTRAETFIEALTGAEAALVVNNNAAAILLALAALASRKEVLVSRGELIEIGGEFRLPDIMAASGAKLVEVGTTNRTRAADYERALSARTGLIMKVHPSNYRVVGFAESTEVQDLAPVARAAGVPLLYDIGSGLLDRFPEVPSDEPAVTEALAAGADLVAFSGDKLLGGPQAGVVTGSADLVEKLRRHPLARAVRVDVMTVAALEAVLRLYANGRRAELPVWQLLAVPQRVLLERAKALASMFPGSSVRPSEALVGGGTLPGYAVPSAELVVPASSAARTSARLRLGRPPVFCRTEAEALAFDLRTVMPGEDDDLARAIRYALEQD